MNPATPVTSAFICLVETVSRTRSGSRRGLPSRIERRVHGVAFGQARLVRGAHDLVIEPHPHGRQHQARASGCPAHHRSVPTAGTCSGPRSPAGRTRRLPSRDSSSPEWREQIGAADLEPDQIVGVVDHAHLVGFGVADADARRGRGGRSTRCGSCADRRALATAFSSRVAVRDRRAEKIAMPATRIRAPAATTRGGVVRIDAAVDLDRRGRVARSIEQRAHRSSPWTRCAG